MDALALGVVLVAARAYAVDVRGLGGVDLLLATDPGVADAEAVQLGITLKADVRELDAARHWQLKLDFAGREGFIRDDNELKVDHSGNTYNNLYELAAIARGLAGRVDLAFGRIKTPGGFLLVVDGAMLTVHYTRWLEQSVYGGLRAFTTGRANTWMTSGEKVALPLVGTTLAAQHSIVQGSIGFTWARDGVDLHTEWIPVEERNRVERHIEDEYFLDGQVTLFPHKRVYASGGVSFGSRYDVQLSPTDPYGPTSIGFATLGAVDVYAIVEYRPVDRLRLRYSFNYERVRTVQSQLLTTKRDGTPVLTADGTFQDHDLRAIGLLWRGLKAELDYRLRFRENTDIEHHVVVGLRGDDLWRGLGGFASVGVDVDQGIDLPGLDPATRKVHDRAIYSAGLSWLRSTARYGLDLRAGILFTDGIGSGLVFSQHLASETNAHPTELFPYVLETNRIAFVRAFATFWKMYAGLDLEENLDLAQLRMLLQVGAAL